MIAASARRFPVNKSRERERKRIQRKRERGIQRERQIFLTEKKMALITLSSFFPIDSAPACWKISDRSIPP
jgi:hypothetical protein